MRPMSILFGGLLMVAVIICAVGFNDGLVKDYTDTLNTTSKINTSDWGYEEIELSISNETNTVESGLLSAIGQTPIIGGTLVQVISPVQTILPFLNSMWQSINIATAMISSVFEIIPAQYSIPDPLIGLIYTAITLTIIGTIIYLLINRKVF